ncbi:alpha-hydroxy-acid oxidizing protein [Amycolatopsis sp. K13G38]|uniref:Alpha-hydroxy-acid oxidizing protein n=1 Tax=Amycolatopsis acididurans TaxID=2724524 RepID=A0ABX1J8G2_9PSEU|nr:alpha-hydroxy acid oxidase [Amycolatopsis acididurans]NKQ56088.1 alpha-hydroxy-acid oxidizing protein [Amycolatopsis acididurans]
MTKRQWPRWQYLRELLRPAPIRLDPVARRLGKAHSIADLRAVARSVTPRAVFEYTDGAAESEISLARAREAFAQVRFHPRVLQDVSQVDTSATILGKPASWPFVFAPTGFTRMMHHQGERAVARVAQDTGVPYALSTMGTTSVEDVAATAPTARKWFQLYLWRDREASEQLIARARHAGYEALILTVDTPVAGARLRDARNGLTIPPTLTLRTLIDGARHPAWWFNLLTTEPLRFASLATSDGVLGNLAGRLFDASATIDDLAWVRERWPGPLIVKGVQTLPDAIRLADNGADALVLSSHGGRQLDRVPAPLELLPSVVKEVGDRAEIYVDSGVLSGGDIVAARALGATACLIGRAYLYGLMAGGQRGVARAVEILANEITTTMRLLGAASLDALHPDHVSMAHER